MSSSRTPVRSLASEAQLRVYFRFCDVSPKPPALERIGGTTSSEPRAPEWPAELKGAYDDGPLLMRIVRERIHHTNGGWWIAIVQDPALRQRARDDYPDATEDDRVRRLYCVMSPAESYLRAALGTIEGHGKERLATDRLNADVDAVRVARALYDAVCIADTVPWPERRERAITIPSDAKPRLAMTVTDMADILRPSLIRAGMIPRKGHT